MTFRSRSRDRMRAWLRRMVIVATFLTVPLRAAERQGRSDVRVAIVVSPEEARVHERYRLPGDTSGIRFQLLDRPCATVRDVTVWNYRDTVTLVRARSGPWQIFRDSTGTVASADSSGFDLSYTVSLAATAVDIPVVLLTRPVPRPEGDRRGAVELSVRLDGDPRSVVTFPALTRTADDSWSGSFVAAPSFVHVVLPNASSETPACQAADGSDVGDGGLTWRFWTLVSIMVAWVPLYLTWARRTREHDV